MSFEPTAIQNLMPAGPHISVAQHGSDRGLFVEFYDEMVPQTFESEAQGIPVYKSVPHIIIHFAGGKSDLKRKVKLVDDAQSPSDPHRFPNQWAAFKANQEQAQSGTPLELMPWLTKEQIYGLKAQRVLTVEHLSNMPDTALAGMGMRDMRDRAQKYLAAASGDHAVISALEAKNKNLERDFEMLKAQFTEMAALQKRGNSRANKENSNAEG